MPLMQTRPELLDQLWKGVRPLLQTRAATIAIGVIRRNPKTAIALGVASLAGALLASIARKRSAARQTESQRLLTGRSNGALPGYSPTATATSSSPAMTQ